MKKPGSLRDPAAGHLRRIFGVNRLFPVIPLKKADAFSAANIDGRNDHHKKCLKRNFTAETAEGAEKFNSKKVKRLENIDYWANLPSW
jgi:hypothetical protein